jgi:tetratricopeptide (TPR) repeat protein
MPKPPKRAEPPPPRAVARAATSPSPWPVVAALIVLTILVFARIAGHDYINYDDPDYVTRNTIVQQGLTASGIRWAFTTLKPYYWQPLTWLSLMLDCSLWGAPASPHLLVNLLLHTTSAVLLFLTLRRATGAHWPSAIAAALWAIHPLRVESVAWVAERKDVLSTLFFLAATLAWVLYAERRGDARYAVVVVLFILALMSKPMVVTLPIALLILDVWPLRRLSLGWRRLIVEKLPLAALAGIVLALTFSGQARAIGNVPLPIRLANAVTGYVAYLGKMVVPTGLAIVYPYRYRINGAAVLAALIVLAAITAAIIVLRKSKPYLAAGWLWYLLTLVPVIGIVQAGPQAMADRFTYLPSIGILVAVVWLIADLVSSSQPLRRLALVGAMLLIGAFAMLSAWQAGFWRNSETLFTHALEVTTDNVVAHLSLGETLLEQRRPDEANAHYAEAVRLSEGAPLPLAEAGAAFLRQKRYAQAIEPLQSAVALDPANSGIQENLGLALLGSSRPADALPHLEAALKLNDGARVTELRQSIGNAKLSLGRGEEALRDLQQAATGSAASRAAATNDLANAYASKGDDARAERTYREAIRLDPKLYDARMNLAALLSRTGHNDEAIAQIREAAKLQPRSVEPRVYLALVLAQLNRHPEAAAAASEAQQLDPKAANDYFTSALRMPSSPSNLEQFIAAMKQ